MRKGIQVYNSHKKGKVTIAILVLMLILAGAAEAQEPPPRIGRLVMPLEYWGYSLEAATREQISPYIIAGVMAIESRFDPVAISGRGRCLGLMQLDKGVARSLGVDPWNPRENIHGGARVLAALLRKHGGNLRLAVRAYNGTGNRAYENEVIKAVRQAAKRGEKPHDQKTGRTERLQNRNGARG